MTSKGQQELDTGQCVLAGFRPFHLLSKVAKLDGSIIDLVLVDLVGHCLLWDQPFSVLANLSETFQESDHAVIEAAMQEAKAEWHVTSGEELKHSTLLLSVTC